MKEIAMSCALPLARRSLHVCEAPGGFVQATAVHAAAADWTWTAISLPPREGVPAFRAEVLPMDRGRVVLADVYAASTLAAVEEGAYDLATADGATDMDHERLEDQHLPLLLAQTRVCLRGLAPGGAFVLKFFEGLTPATTAHVAWLTTLFDEVCLIKPSASRPTNSERYVVCRGRTAEAAPPPPTALHVASGWRAHAADTLDRMAREQARAIDAALARARSQNAPPGHASGARAK
jgi:23S rRNA U2552 (ribose-2'-O)-methylase RlmE/FtsJ